LVERVGQARDEDAITEGIANRQAIQGEPALFHPSLMVAGEGSGGHG
jgi:hypothetical protein